MKFEYTDVWGFEHAIRGMRNPLESWERSDSIWEWIEDESPINPNDLGLQFVIGPNDLTLMQKLIKAGSEHRKFMRQIFVSVDITAPLYWWKEFDTYKVGTVANSCSTMHKIQEKELTLDDFSHEHLLTTCDLGFENHDDSSDVKVASLSLLQTTCNYLNGYRKTFLKTRDKFWWWQMIQLLPSSYNQKRTVTLNYENLYSMVKQREGHKLTEWSEEFIKWAKSLPYAEELIFIE